MLNEDHLDQLRNAMMDYIDAHGLPTEPAALEWFQLAAREGTDVFDAFAPMYETYFEGNAGPGGIDEWMKWTYNIDITISPSIGGGVYVYFDFDFEDDTGDYSGSRGGRGHI